MLAGNAIFDKLAERSLMSPLAGTKHTYVRLAIIIHCKILVLFSNTVTTREKVKVKKGKKKGLALHHCSYSIAIFAGGSPKLNGIKYFDLLFFHNHLLE